MTPRSEAIAFRIWSYATPRGWNCTCGEIADELGLSAQAVGAIAKLKKWINRMPANHARMGYLDIDTVQQSGLIGGFDDL